MKLRENNLRVTTQTYYEIHAINSVNAGLVILSGSQRHRSNITVYAALECPEK